VSHCGGGCACGGGGGIEDGIRWREKRKEGEIRARKMHEENKKVEKYDDIMTILLFSATRGFTKCVL
jgi:hypothetical protein